MRKKMQWWLVSLVASGTLGLKSPVRAGHGPVRREFVSGFGRALGSFGALLSGASSAAGYAETSQVAPGFTSAKDEFPLRTYVDPLFDLTFPKDFFAIRRTIDGDIVRRGGVIFTAGQLKTAEIVTVELFAVKELLAQAEALPYFPEGRIKKWSDLGNDKALGGYLCERRDNAASAASKGRRMEEVRASEVVPGSLSVEGNVLQAELVTTIGGMDYKTGDAGTPMKTPGIRRVQRCRLTLLEGGREVMGVWGGCLDDYWDSGESEVLRNVVASFVVKKTGDSTVLPDA